MTTSQESQDYSLVTGQGTDSEVEESGTRSMSFGNTRELTGARGAMEGILSTTKLRMFACAMVGLVVGVLLASFRIPDEREATLSDAPIAACSPHAAQDIIFSRSWGSGTCSEYGCGPYQDGRNCQCNVECQRYNSCCHDYKAMCASCEKLGCSQKYHRHQPCQCSDQCEKYGNCCHDYQDHCGGGAGRPEPVPSPIAPTPSVRPPAPSPKSGSLNGVFGHPSSRINYPKYEGFTLLLAEEFDEPIDLDKDPIWTWSDGGLREGSVRFRKEAIKFKDGKMRIEVSKTSLPPLDSCSHASVEEIPYKPLMSGEMRSKYNMFRYGRYEVRMRAPHVKRGNPGVNGNFIATMFAYRDANAHHWREIDFEITGDAPNSLTTNLLYADGTKNWKPYLQDSRQPGLGNVNVRQDFHTYMFEWTPQGVTWFVDGKEVRKGSRLQVPEMSTKIMMNLWIFTGGAFGGHEINNNEYPFYSEYEYFRFYKWDGDDKYPCKDMTESCLTDDDMYLTGNNPCDGIAQEGLLEGSRVCTTKCLGAAAAPYSYV